MATTLASCCNAGATSWVLALISTTYCVPVLTCLVRRRKVTTSQAAAFVSESGTTDRWNQLSKHLLSSSETTSLFAVIIGSPSFPSFSRFHFSLSTQGERSA